MFVFVCSYTASVSLRTNIVGHQFPVNDSICLRETGQTSFKYKNYIMKRLVQNRQVSIQLARALKRNFEDSKRYRTLYKKRTEAVFGKLHNFFFFINQAGLLCPFSQSRS